MLSSANGVEDVDLARTDRRGKALLSFYIVAADKDIYVLADLALFVEDTVAKGEMLLPERIECITNGGELARQLPGCG